MQDTKCHFPLGQQKLLGRNACELVCAILVQMFEAIPQPVKIKTQNLHYIMQKKKKKNRCVTSLPCRLQRLLPKACTYSIKLYLRRAYYWIKLNIIILRYQDTKHIMHSSNKLDFMHFVLESFIQKPYGWYIVFFIIRLLKLLIYFSHSYKKI